IKTFIGKEFGIANALYLGRIAEIARGNPRLAVMAAKVAVRENTFQSLRDVSALYDEYFRSIRADFLELGNRELLKLAGIVAFFRVLDRSHSESMQTICAAFDLSPETFWNAVERLHELEAVDLYENEVARISDQVLATYLLYLALFKERILNISTFLS